MIGIRRCTRKCSWDLYLWKGRLKNRIEKRRCWTSVKPQPQFQSPPLRGLWCWEGPQSCLKVGLRCCFHTLTLSLVASYLGKRCELGQGNYFQLRAILPVVGGLSPLALEFQVVHQSIYFFLPHSCQPLRGEMCPGDLPSIHVSHPSSSLRPPCH